MKQLRIFKRKQPWRDALIATTGLSLFTLVSTLLWSSGYPQWAFTLVFISIWLLISISWSNIEFTEESGSILARIVDHNFSQVNERLEELEQELASIKVTGYIQEPVHHEHHPVGTPAN